MTVPEQLLQCIPLPARTCERHGKGTRPAKLADLDPAAASLHIFIVCNELSTILQFVSILITCASGMARGETRWLRPRCSPRQTVCGTKRTQRGSLCR